jgi:DNA anti-recombination protein RmuC
MDVSQNVLETLKKSLEEKGTNQVLELHKKKHHINDLLNVIKEGEKEFIKTVGRNMTYSEIREMYG